MYKMETVDHPAGRLRVNVDLSGGKLLHRPGDDVERVVGALVKQNVELCVGDVDRSLHRGTQWELIASLLDRAPGVHWVSGGLDPVGAQTALAAGAKGVTIGIGTLRAFGTTLTDALDQVASMLTPGRLCVSIDFKNDVLTHRFYGNRPGLRWDELAAEVLENTHHDVQILAVNLGPYNAKTDWSLTARLRERFPNRTIWYGGGLATWRHVMMVWSHRLGATVARAFLAGETLGLPEGGDPL